MAWYCVNQAYVRLPLKNLWKLHLVQNATVRLLIGAHPSECVTAIYLYSINNSNSQYKLGHSPAKIQVLKPQTLTVFRQSFFCLIGLDMSETLPYAHSYFTYSLLA